MSNRIGFLVLTILVGLSVATPGISQGLLLRYTFDEGTGDAVGDSTGAFPGTVTDTAIWDPNGAFGGCIDITQGGYVEADHRVWQALSGVEVTITFWINMDPDATTPWAGNMMHAGPGWGGNTPSDIRFYQGSMIWWPDWSGWAFSTDVAESITGNWQHFAFVKAAEEKTFYMNGEVAYSYPETREIPVDTITAFTVGARADDGSEALEGKLDDFRIYDGALSQEEVRDTMIADKFKSYSPSPANRAADVQSELLTLSWVSGDFAAEHDIYLGESMEDVNAATPADDEFLQTQAENLYLVSDELELGKTYYWRVDEVNEATAGSPWKGDVWSFEVEPYAYPITPASAEASSTLADVFGAINTINGSGLDSDDLHSALSTDMWQSGFAPTVPVTIEYAFDDVYVLNDVLIWNSNQYGENVQGLGVKDLAIETSVDGQVWTKLGDYEIPQAPGAPGYAASPAIDMAGVSAQYVKLVMNSNWAGTQMQFGLSEVRFSYIPLKARMPEPADGDTAVDPASSLTWRSGRTAVQHEVAMGEDMDNLDVKGTVDVPLFDAASANLELAKTYYWQVTEINGVDRIPGDVWSFSTIDMIVIDDFDGYTDTDDGAVWATWGDGWDVDENGSQVGHYPAPYSESTIVRGSRGLSMPLYYTNSGTATYSEAIREGNWDLAANGVKGLVLYFFGDPDNTGGRLYVKIGNTKVLYDGDPEDLKRAAWTKWYIVLADVAGDLSDVKSLTVGIDNGGEGIIYVDDMLLTPEARNLVTPVEPASSTLVGHYPLNEGSGTSVGDASGNNHNGSFVGGPTWVAGKYGQALNIPGEGNAVNLGTWNPSASSGQLSAWMWIKWGGLDGRYQGLISKKTTAADMMWQFHTDIDTGLIRVWQGEDGELSSGNTPSSPAEDVWEHWGFTYDGTTTRIYRNGEVVVETDEFSFAQGTTATLSLGAISPDGVEAFRGAIDEVRLYDSMQSDAEIGWLSGRRQAFDM